VKLYAQLGWGKGEKVDRGLTNDVLDGVILSPHDENPDDLRAYIGGLSRRSPAADLLLDPQLYVSTIRNANEGKLPQYGYYRQGLSLRDLATVRNIQQLVSQCIDYQRDLQLTHVLSPTICAESFTDRSAQIALTMAQEAIDYWAGIEGERRPLLISFLFSEVALANSDQVSEFLDTISLMEADGFYLIVDRATPVYSQEFEPSRLARMMRLIYSLKRSRFQVVCGYSDFVSLLYASAGASAVATGWSQKLRRFNRSRFRPSAGGRRPRDRYSSSRLINSIYLTELDACQDVQMLRAVRSNTRYDQCFDGRSYPSGISWSPDEATLHHWSTISDVIESAEGGSVRERIGEASETIAEAVTLYGTLAEAGVTFEPQNGPAHLEDWIEAIRIFLAEIRA